MQFHGAFLPWRLKPLCLAILLLMPAIPQVVGQVPNVVDFQGTLFDGSGTAITGQRSIAFRIYSASSGGDLLWEESQAVTIADGVYNVALGSVNAFADEVWSHPQLWLALKVGSDGEMAPRTRILAVPFALRAKVAERVESSSGGGGAVLAVRLYAGANSTTYGNIFIDRTGITDEPNAQVPAPRAGTLKNLFLLPGGESGAPTVGTVVTLRVNGADTTLTVTGNGGITSNLNDRVSVEVGDLISVKIFTVKALGTNAFVASPQCMIVFE
jgi:hypothetical protein